ncbi:MAG: DUF721 domain-containing protein [Candidatus Saganbacteria bacterium]|nr:DUF721 domain-containing protein [Candidatus Saganbacteria bacterium]
MVTSLRQILEGNPFFQTLKFSSAWDKALGQHITKHARPVKFQDGILTIAASSQAWATQLRFLAAEIKAKLNQFFGKEEIVGVRFFVDMKEGNQGKQEKEKEKEVEEKNFTCILCGVKIGKAGQCQTCKQQEKEDRKNRAMGIFRKTPWISFSEAAAWGKPIEREEFDRAKKRIKEGFYDQLWKAAKELSRKELKDVSKIRNILYDYVMVKTGKKPGELNVKILQKSIPAKLWQIIKETVKN